MVVQLTNELKEKIPKTLEGYPVRVEETGEIKPLEDSTKQPQLELRTRVLKGGKVIFNGNLRPVVAEEGSAPPFRIITGGVIKLLSLTPDDYTLEVVVRDKLRKKEAVTRREIDFSVNDSPNSVVAFLRKYHMDGVDID